MPCAGFLAPSSQSLPSPLAMGFCFSRTWFILHAVRVPLRCVEPGEPRLWDGQLLHTHCDPLGPNVSRHAAVDLVEELTMEGTALGVMWQFFFGGGGC